MPADLVQPATSLGVAGFAILIMWWAYQSSVEERKRYDARLDARDESYRKLEKEVRTEITTQLIAATTALKENGALMKRVIEKI